MRPIKSHMHLFHANSDILVDPTDIVDIGCGMKLKLSNSKSMPHVWSRNTTSACLIFHSLASNSFTGRSMAFISMSIPSHGGLSKFDCSSCALKTGFCGHFSFKHGKINAGLLQVLLLPHELRLIAQLGV